MVGVRTLDRRFDGADESTKLWRLTKSHVQCDQIVFSIFGHLEQCKFAKKHARSAKVS